MRRAMEDVGLDPERFLDRYPHQLSGGQRQRVAIAAALVLEPEGLICDEPVSMLDVSVRAQILQRAGRAAASGAGSALLFITHDLSLAWSLCDRIAVMYLGRIVEQGSAVDVIERPAAPVHAGAGGRGPGADGRAAAAGATLLGGELPDADERPDRAAASTRAARGASSPATASTRRCSRPAARASWPPACCTTRRSSRPGPTLTAERAGATSPGRSAGSSRARATRSPTCRACASGHAQAASGQRTGVTVVAPPALPARAGDGASSTAMGELTAKLEIDERGVMETPVYLCGTHARRHRLPGGGRWPPAAGPTTS